MKPLSARSLLRPAKYGSSAPTGRPVRGSRTPVAAGATRVMRSIPFERPHLPLVDKSDGQDRKKHHHRPEAVGPELAVHDRPRKQKRAFEIEDDEQDGDE